MYIIGENIQILSPRIKAAIADRDATYVRELARKQVEHGANMLDLNIGPRKRDGVEVMQWMIEEVYDEVGNVPLSLDTTNAAAIEAGADCLSLINTVRAMAINVDTWEPMLANRTGGLSGPAIRPIAVQMVHQVYRQVAARAGVPLIGMGGIRGWRDAVEFILAGASAVAVGTALFVDPRTPAQICDGLCGYLERRGQASVRALVGQLN